MIGKSILACSLLVPALALVSGGSLDSKVGDTPTDSAVTTELLNDESALDMSTCTFDFLATNNLSFDVFVDFYYSTVRLNGVAIFDTTHQLKIQNYRIGTGKSIRARYTASGGCSRTRSWDFLVRIGRPDGRKIYKHVDKTTRDDGQTTINLGKSSTWGL